jgi:hypothetical protein
MNQRLSNTDAPLALDN